MKYEAKFENFGVAGRKCDCRLTICDHIFGLFCSDGLQMTYFDLGKLRGKNVITYIGNAIA